MRCHEFKHVLVGTLGCLIILGCNRSPTGAEKNDSPEHPSDQTIQELFNTAMEASDEPNWKVYLDCLTTDAQNEMTTGNLLVLAAAYLTVVDDDKASRPYKDLFGRHDISGSLWKDLMSDVHDNSIGERIQDKPAFAKEITELLETRFNADYGYDMPPEDRTLENIRVSGDIATAKIANQNRWVLFKKESERWRIGEIPFSDPSKE